MGWVDGFIVAALVSLLSSSQAKRTSDRRAISHEQYQNAVSADLSAVEIFIDTHNVKARNITAPNLYGLMFEDINHSGDGGIYGELLANRAFQGSSVKYGQLHGVSGNSIVGSENEKIPNGPVLTGWEPIGNVRMTLDILHPLSEALPTVMQLDIPKNATGEVGFMNNGWWGIDVRPQDYTASFFVLANAPRKTSNSTSFTLSLRSNLTGQTWASSIVRGVDIPTFEYVQLNSTISNSRLAPNINNTFAITMDASQVAGHTLYFGLISLFPETFKGRKNGLRKDLAQAFYDLKPKFLRFPGGNNLEGVSVQTRWRWWKTIGPLKDRPGRPADWDYFNTDGLGLLEYLQWCEDMSMEPVLAVYAGFSLDVYGQSGTSYPPSKMHEVIQEALDELEYCMGPVSTKYGALRAAHGHPAPFSIKFVEIGNEDWFSTTYPYRWTMMFEALRQAYPGITYISTTFDEHSEYKIKLPRGTIWDTHHYEEPQYFLRNFNYFDNWQARTNNSGVGVLLGEYSVFQVDTPSGVVDFKNPPNIHVTYPRMLSALAEGVYALGGERNPHVVGMSSYAPSLQNLNWYNWTPNMIHFTANPDETILSASYWQQWMFARYRGTHTLPTTNTKGALNPLFWATSIDASTNVVYVKIINTGNATVPITVNLDRPYTGVNGTILSGPDVHSFNSMQDKMAVSPKPLKDNWKATKTLVNGTLEWHIPKWSITVVQFNV